MDSTTRHLNSLHETGIRRIAEANLIGLIVFHLDGRILDANDAFLQITGYTRDDLRSGRVSWAAMTPPEYQALDVKGVEELRETGVCLPFEKEYIRKDGSRIPILIGAAWMEGAEDEGIAFIVNITEPRRNQAELKQLNETLRQRVAERTATAERRTQELIRSEAQLRESERHFKELAERNKRLVEEVEHRVRNNLSGLLGLVSLMREKTDDVATFAHAMESRLWAMAHVHDLLAVAGWRSVGLQTLVTSTLDTMASMALFAAEAAIEGPNVPISPRHVLPLTMILVEWFTNSCKYGAHSAPGGRLSITWQTAPGGTADAPRIGLAWRETGGPPISQPRPPSLGSELVRAFVQNELQGTCRMAFPPDGADHLIEFPSRPEREPRGFA